MSGAFINRIATAVPPNDVHHAFLDFGRRMLAEDARKRALFDRMAERSGIGRRFSVLRPGGSGGAVDADGFYRLGAFPGTAARMRKYEEFAPALAVAAAEKLLTGEDRSRITHVVVTSCTGFSAPGVDLQLVERCGLRPEVERTLVGFMGCYAAINALKLARHMVRSDPVARVLAVNLELCTLHLHETDNLEEILSFLLFADGCAAACESDAIVEISSGTPISALTVGDRGLLVPGSTVTVTIAKVGDRDMVPGIIVEKPQSVP